MATAPDTKFKPSPSRDAEFTRLWNADATGKQIAERLSLAPGTVWAIARRLGLPKRGQRSKIARSGR